VSDERRPRINIDPGAVLVEVFSVTLAILLALGIGAWQGQVRDHRRLDDAASNIVAELAKNRALIGAVHPRHVRLLDAFDALSRRPENARRITLQDFQTAIRAGAPHGSGLAIPQSMAWQIAQTSQALDLMPYADRARLTGLYDLQTFYFAQEQQYVDQLLAPSVPPDGNFLLVVASNQGRLQDVVNLETTLMHEYSRNAAQLRLQFPHLSGGSTQSN
jgi:hypothetical protein